MIVSLRRIGTALFFVGVFSLGLSSLGVFAGSCGVGGASCWGAAFAAYPTASYQTDFAIANKTSESALTIVSFSDVMETLQVVSPYLLVFSLLWLLALEVFEVYYIRKFLRFVGQFRVR